MGGAKAWDAQRDQQLFMLVVNCIKVDWKLIADEWAKKYREFHPAITCHTGLD